MKPFQSLHACKKQIIHRNLILIFINLSEIISKKKPERPNEHYLNDNNI